MSNKDALDRFNRRKKLKQDKKEDTYLKIVPDEKLVRELQSSQINPELVNDINKSIEEKYYVNTEVQVSDTDVKAMLEGLRDEFDKDKFNILIENCKNTVVDSIIRPFGLSSSLFEDKEGGNVTTVHNFENNITANEADAQRAKEWHSKYGKNIDEAERSKFDRSDYQKDYIAKRDRIVENNIVNGNIDSYTGYEIEGKPSVDHVVSEHEVDKNSRANLFLSKDERSKMVNDDSNLKPTSTSINSSKQDKSMGDFLDTQATGAPKGVTNSDKFGINKDKAMQADKEARENMDKTLRKAQFKKQGSELMSTGVKEGFKMGLQQSIGLLMKEFTEAVFYEIKDIYSKGFKNENEEESFIHVLKQRLVRVAEKVISKWKNVVEAFKDGAISGFFSNLVTFIINCVVKTEANVVRIIREGFFSIVKAIKMLINPPEGMNMKQAANEATKLLAAAVVISGGILIEEGLETFMKSIPVIGVFGEFLTPVIMGILTGLTTTFVVYMIDKVDIFGVNFEDKHNFIMNKLDSKIDQSLTEIENSFQNFSVPSLDVIK